MGAPPRPPRKPIRWRLAAASRLRSPWEPSPSHNKNVSVLAIVIVTLLGTALLLFVGANLATTEKRLLYRPRRLYTSEDADFRRALGILLGPPLVTGNRITTLVNGNHIYAAMLNAIRAAQSEYL